MANKTAASRAASLMGKRSYKGRLERIGLERLQEIVRENGELGGRPIRKRNYTKIGAEKS
jgi:hypothetical protein